MYIIHYHVLVKANMCDCVLAIQLDCKILLYAYNCSVLKLHMRIHIHTLKKEPIMRPIHDQCQFYFCSFYAFLI